MAPKVIMCRAASGAGRPPVLFVHGAYHAAWCWEENFLRHFSQKGFDAYALNLRGHGDNEGDGSINQWGLEHYCDDVREACDGLHMPPILVGHSIGAVIVQRYVQSHRALGIVMLAPTPLAPIPLAKLRWAIRFPIRTILALTSGDMNYLLPTFRHLFFSPEMPAEMVDYYMGKMRRESKQVFHDLSHMRDYPREVRVPTLILTAMQDLTPARINRSLAKALNAEIYRLPIAHDIMLDPQWQTAADLVVGWIEERLIAVPLQDPRSEDAGEKALI